MTAEAFAAQEPPRERTLEEIKTEALARARTGMYPMIGLDPADVSEAFEHIKSKDMDEWAAAFDAVADRYMAQGKSLESSDGDKANAAYLRAFNPHAGVWRRGGETSRPLPFRSSPRDVSREGFACGGSTGRRT